MNPPYVAEAYYNHTIYTAGWSYKDYTIGNPFLPHLNTDPTKIVHIGMNGLILKNYHYQIQISKKIDVNDLMRYRVDIKKEFNALNTLGIFIVNNGNKKNGVGAIIYWEL